jgi:hypothetical protein
MQNGWAGQASREKDGELGAAFGRNVSATICSSVKGQATIETFVGTHRQCRTLGELPGHACLMEQSI